MSNGIAVGTAVEGLNVSLRSLDKKIHPIPRIETKPIAIGIRSVRSNGGRGCIPGKVLPRLYPHSFHYKKEGRPPYSRILPMNRNPPSDNKLPDQLCRWTIPNP